MNGSDKRRRPMRTLLLGLAMGVGLSGTVGCQVDMGGQTLPSPWYIQDDPQYFPAGPEMKVAREAAAMQAHAQNAAARPIE